MKKLFVIVTALFSIGKAEAQSTLDYSYQDVFSSNADEYVVSSSNIETTSEPNNDYLNPIVSGEEAQITYKFTLDAPITEAYLNTQLGMFNFGGASGSGSLWASTDDSNWQLLLNAPTPTTISEGYVYDQNLPSSLLGGDSIYIQTRLLSSGDNIFAQYSRTDDTYNAANPSFRIFTFKASTVPEPSASDIFGLGVIALLALCIFHSEKTPTKLS